MPHQRVSAILKEWDLAMTVQGQTITDFEQLFLDSTDEYGKHLTYIAGQNGS
jgi:hypothetical protein